MRVPGGKIKNPTALTVRRMRAEDLSAALSILRESPEASMWSVESLLEWTSNKAAWVADLNDEAVGFLIGRVAGGEFEILNLAVGVGFRRRGVAAQLVSAALESSRSAGARQAYLEVRASNEAAIALYKQMGFRVCGSRRNYYGHPAEDAVLLGLHDFETLP
jgi:[ribosomal protein S18]-alanine N-acetyltransferase